MESDKSNDRCRSCGGPLEVLDRDGARRKVECLYCGDAYVVVSGTRPDHEMCFREVTAERS